jgi:endonuclease/exonuclease/phosphatase family metal-dependent hydrolase
MRKKRNKKFDFIWLCLAALLHFGCDVEGLPEQVGSDKLIGGLKERLIANNGQGVAAASGTNQGPSIVPAGNQLSQQSGLWQQPSMPTITIASFNIQVFGTTKVGDRWVLDRLAATIRAFDVVAIQEIRANDQTLIEQFIQAINSDGSQYSYVIGPRVGRTSSKEQYAFVYNTKRIVCLKEQAYTVSDPSNLLHRPSLVAHFQVLAGGQAQPFSFTLINIHTDPDEIDSELNVLADVYKNVRQYEYPEDDVILLGDLNCGPKDFKALGQIPGIYPLIQNVATNTRQTKLYDNIVVDGYSSQEFTGRSGVWNLQQYYKITLDDALRLSDHFPVWAEFSAYEVVPQMPAMATQPSPAGQPVR